jgi:deoxyribonuclease-4
MKIGAHVGQEDAITQAKAIGAEQVQVFLGDPQGWKGPEFGYPGGAAALRADAEAAGLDLYVHAPYVINVASTNNRIRIPSRKLLQQIVQGAALIGAKGVVVHGGHVSAKDEPAVGFDNWRKAIDSLETEVPVLIENTAGGDFSMARRLERIEQLWAAVSAANGAEMVGFCLDTCHAWAGGIDLATAVEQVRAITGRIDLVHANDSRDAAGSGADRHAHFGEGSIPGELLAGVVAAAGAPVICETHGDMGPDIAWLRERVG